VEIQLAVKKGKTTTSSLTVRHFPTLIGRHRECNLRIAARQVSRRHCVLKSRDGWLVVCDLESCNGTLVNGRAIRGDQVLLPGDQLEIGPIIFEVTYSAPSNVAQSNDASDTQILASGTTHPSLDAPLPEEVELSDRISELDRLKSLDLLDTHRPGDTLFNPSDSGSKIVVLGDDVDDPGSSSSKSLFGSDYSRSRERKD